MKLDIPDIAKGKILPHIVTQKEAEQCERKKNIRLSWLQCLVSAVVGAIIGNIDRIIDVIKSLMQ